MKMHCMLPLLLALSACGGQESDAPSKTSSFGEVLPGSASDAMLPYNTATSAPPLEAPDAASSAAPESSAPRTQATSAETTDEAEPEADAEAKSAE